MNVNCKNKALLVALATRLVTTNEKKTKKNKPKQSVAKYKERNTFVVSDERHERFGEFSCEMNPTDLICNVEKLLQSTVHDIKYCMDYTKSGSSHTFPVNKIKKKKDRSGLLFCLYIYA